MALINWIFPMYALVGFIPAQFLTVACSYTITDSALNFSSIVVGGRVRSGYKLALSQS